MHFFTKGGPFGAAFFYACDQGFLICDLLPLGLGPVGLGCDDGKKDIKKTWRVFNLQ